MLLEGGEVKWVGKFRQKRRWKGEGKELVKSRCFLSCAEQEWGEGGRGFLDFRGRRKVCDASPTSGISFELSLRRSHRVLFRKDNVTFSPFLDRTIARSLSLPLSYGGAEGEAWGRGGGGDAGRNCLFHPRPIAPPHPTAFSPS